MEASGHRDPSTLGYRQELKRSLRLRDLIVYGMIFMVPIAPMAIYGYVAQQSFGMVPLVYIIGIVAMVFTALSYKQMSAKFPIAGSVYSYVQRGLNPHVGFVAGWMILADYLLAPSLLYAFSAGWLHGLVPSVPTLVWLLFFVLFNTVVNVLGITLQARTNFILLAIELVCLLIFLIASVRFVFALGHGAGHLSFNPFYQPSHFNLKFIENAASIAVLSFLGFDAISTLAEETERPEKTVGNATIASLVIIGLLFVLQTYVAALVHPNYADLNPNMAFFQIAKEAGGTFLYILLIIVNAVASGIANALAAQSAISRILYSMGRDNLLPFSKFFSHVSPRFQTPVNATLLVAVISLLVASLVPQETITTLVNFGALTAFLMLNATVFVYFSIRQRGFRHVFKYLLFPLCGFVVIGYVWLGFDRTTFIFGLSWMALGILIGAVKSKGYREVPPVLKDM
ncbi:APC family permease [Alicyclobacillus acidocaldarius]|uniref:Amino acid permease-associated region n=1 Tax=Alicyclobacillus acidocaldarius subsp. acidocaldarius (strain ATCC 27009 / DSM 446 / BCRC 14685 / JCM 5260 / KCTC 1825 / NBRC 15652 / NCIMB 11725 / NRRL B-14509 / 104-IA) TaxID=521098 RepID=C8WR04_ALIAD|nr:APC family permease [Alicyclobacillus acidocaldarius]ACV59173.1 amino acid permease-associated region [Alicyclobacillus acidocaldarius subsp. acidocaldarius DSM 446]